ncbi:MAG: hypothetical protein LBO80_04860, partial [Treponema sp.]|nr:hypothetical protein [Treponema sp.]
MPTATIADVFNAASVAANTTTNILSGIKKEKDDLYIRNALLDLENMGNEYLLELDQSNDSTAAGNEYEGYASGWRKRLDQWQKKNGNVDNYTRERLSLAAR